MSNFFDISFSALNLFSFILGAFWSVSSCVGFYGKRDVWVTIIFYFIGVAVYFYLQAHPINLKGLS
jgi:hypothetical protein